MKDLLTELKRLDKAVEKGGHYGFSQGIWAECIARIEILEAPAREAIKEFEGDGADTMAVLNAYIKRCTRQQAELAKLNWRVGELARALAGVESEISSRFGSELDMTEDTWRVVFNARLTLYRPGEVKP